MTFTSSSLPSAPHDLSPGEWRDVQAALRAVQAGRSQTGLARFVPHLRTCANAPVAPELVPLRDFMCETARHGPAVAELAQALAQQGYSPAQIAALALIAG